MMRGQIWLAQLRMKTGKILLQSRQRFKRAIGFISFAARKHKGAPQIFGVSVALEQQDFHAGFAFAQHEHGGRITGRGVNNVRGDFHKGPSWT